MAARPTGCPALPPPRIVLPRQAGEEAHHDLQPSRRQADDGVQQVGELVRVVAVLLCIGFCSAAPNAVA